MVETVEESSIEGESGGEALLYLRVERRELIEWRSRRVLAHYPVQQMHLMPRSSMREQSRRSMARRVCKVLSKYMTKDNPTICENYLVQSGTCSHLRAYGFRIHAQ